MRNLVLAAVAGMMVAGSLAAAACQSDDSSSSGGDSTGAGAGPGGGGSSGSGGSTAGAGGSTAGSGGSAAGAGGDAGAGGSTAGAGGSTAGSGGSTAGSGGSAAGSAGSGGGICNTPTTLHPPDGGAPGAKTLYCPFSGVDGGKNDYCVGAQEHCCEGSKPGDISSCKPLATACNTGDTDWQCTDPATECNGGMKCCGSGQLVVNTDPKCANFASKFTGTKCAASCDPVLEIQMCTSDAQCPSGKKCIPFGSKGNQVGGCEK